MGRLIPRTPVTAPHHRCMQWKVIARGNVMPVFTKMVTVVLRVQVHIRIQMRVQHR